MTTKQSHSIVIPVQAGINVIPAFAGMTVDKIATPAFGGLAMTGTGC